jgi:hypothetical protein
MRLIWTGVYGINAEKYLGIGRFSLWVTRPINNGPRCERGGVGFHGALNKLGPIDYTNPDTQLKTIKQL